MGAQEFVRAACIGPVRAARHWSRRATTSGASVPRSTGMGSGARAFMNAASPGLVTAFQPNQFYPSHEAYLADLVDAMRPEYEAIVAAGFALQLDCPDLAMRATPATRTWTRRASCAWSRPTSRR